MPQISMLSLFDQCQEGMQCHNKLIKAMAKLQNSMEFSVFWSEFVHYLKYSMLIFKREPAVERTIDFVAKYVTFKQQADAGDQTKSQTDDGDQAKSQTDVDDGASKLLMAMFEFLLQSHSAVDRAVRFRCCQLVNKLLSNLGDNAQIDDDLYEVIYTAMLERLQDKTPVVRVHATLALSRLQDPTDEKCPIIKAYIFLLSRDPNPDVRRAVLSCIAPSTKTLLPIIERTRDVKDTVRRAAYHVIAEKIHIKALSIAQRIQLLQDGLGDRSDVVKDACATKLLQTWLVQFQGSALKLLESLDVEQSADVCQQVLVKLFEKAPVDEIIVNFDLLDEGRVLPDDKLTCESVMYWRVLCQFVHDKGAQFEEDLEKIMPTCIGLCQYVRRFLEKLTNCGDDFDRQLELEYMGQQILSLFKYMDLTDQAGRRELEKLLHDLLICDFVSHALVKPIVSALHLIKSSTDSLTAYFAETISEIREPITITEKSLAEDEKRQLNIKIAHVRVRVNQVKEDMEDCVRAQEFDRASSLKKDLSDLDAERSALLDQAEPQQEEVRTEKNDAFTILKCLTIVCELMTQLPQKTLTPTLQMLLESQVLPGVQSAEADVRNTAVKALGLCCLLKEDVVMQYVPLLIEVSLHDTETVKSVSLRCLFDLVHQFGLGVIKEEPNSTNQQEGAETEDQSQTVNSSLMPDDTFAMNESRITAKKSNVSIVTDIATKLVAILSGFLDSESSELRTVAAEGMAKLLLSGRVVSAKLLSHLLLLWYNPLTDDDNHLRHCLGAFFPLFAFASRGNQELFEEAFLPTLSTLLNAPLSSPLNEVNVFNVAVFLLQLINSKLIISNNNNNSNTNAADNPGHAHVAEIMCNEILSGPDSFNVGLWTRLLNQLQLGPDLSHLKAMTVLCQQMLEVVKEKPNVKSIKRFKATVDDLLSTASSTTVTADPGEITAVPASDVTSPSSQDTCSTAPSSQASSVEIASVTSASQTSDIAVSIEDSLSGAASSQEAVAETADETETPSSLASSNADNTSQATRKTKTRSTRVKSVKTPGPTVMPQVHKSNRPTTARRLRATDEANSELENNVFASPLRGTRSNLKNVPERPRRNLQSQLAESEDKTQSASEASKTPTRNTRYGSRTPKRNALTDVNGD